MYELYRVRINKYVYNNARKTICNDFDLNNFMTSRTIKCSSHGRPGRCASYAPVITFFSGANNSQSEPYLALFIVIATFCSMALDLLPRILSETYPFLASGKIGRDSSSLGFGVDANAAEWGLVSRLCGGHAWWCL